MKKLLALVLALVMSMSLVTISNAAFKDADTIDNKEAVEVMNAAGVLIGDENGNFNAKANLTRGQAAKIIAYLDLGGKTADAIKGTGTAFTDVPASHWAAGYIEYCAGAGYVAGVGGGKFDPEAQVTGVQFAKMLLCALGYKAEVEGYNGTDYTIAVARDANKNELFKSLSIVTSASLTREQAAQMAFNALKATTVEYQGGTNVTTGDTTVVVNAVRNEVKRTSGNDYRNGTAETATGTQQLVEKLYGTDLKYASTGIADAMNRPAHSWSWKNVEIGTYAKTADKTLVVDKFGKSFADMAKTINSKYTFKDDGVEIVTINGNDAYDDTTDTAQVGDVMELYLNSSKANQVDCIVVTRYDGAKVTSKVATKTVDGVDYVRVPGIMNTYAKAEKIHGYEDLEKDDIVVYYDGVTDGDYYFAKAESFEGQITAIKDKVNNTPAKFTIDGEEKMVNESAGAVDNMTNNGVNANAVTNYNTAYKFYTDVNGYIVYAEQVEDALSDYVTIKDIAWVDASGVATNGYAEARIIKMDGTTEVVKVASINGYKPVKADTNLSTKGDYTVNVSGVTIGSLYTTGSATNAVSSNKFGAGKFYAVGDDGTALASTDKYVGVDETAASNSKTDATGLTNTFFTYTINSDGNYELKLAASYGAVTVAQSHALKENETIANGKVANDGVTVNDKTVFVVNNKLDGSSNSYTVYDGKSAVPTLDDAEWIYVTKDDVAAFVVVKSYDSKTSSGNSVYFLQNYDSVLKYTTVKRADKTTYQYAEVKAIVNGEITTVKVNASSSSVSVGTNFAVGELYDPTFNGDGIIESLSPCDEDVGVAYGYELTNGTLVTKAGGNAGSYVCTEDTVVYYKNIDGNYVTGTFADYEKDANDAIYVVKKAATGVGDDTVKFAYVEEKLDGGLDILAVDNDATYADATALDETAIINNATVNGVSTVSVFVKKASGADTIKFSTNGTNYYDKTGDNGGCEFYTVSCADGVDKVVYVKVITGSVETVYQINLAVSAALAFNTTISSNGFTGLSVKKGSTTLSTGAYVATGTELTVTLTGTAAANKTMQIKSGDTVLGSVAVEADDTEAEITIEMPNAATTLTVAAVDPA